VNNTTAGDSAAAQECENISLYEPRQSLSHRQNEGV